MIIVWPRPLRFSFLLAVACLVSPSESSAQTSQSPLTQDEIKDIESRSDFFRMTGEVEFDGQRIVYDEVIEVQTKLGFTSNMGLVQGDNATLSSRVWVTRQLKGRQGLIMEVADAGGLWTDLEARGQPQKEWTPEYIEQYLRPPAEYLPEFYWVDNLDHPEAVEAYVSEGYYDQRTARLKIVKPIRLAFVPSSEEAHHLAVEQMKSEPHFNFRQEEAGGRFRWQAVTLFPVPKEQWSSIPEIRSAIEAQSTQAVIEFDKEPVSSLHGFVREAKAGDSRAKAFGVPQSKKYPKLEGVLYGTGAAMHADMLIPAKCEPFRKVCDPLFDQHGYYIFTDQNLSRYGVELTIGGASIHVLGGQAVYVARTETVYLVMVIFL